MPSQYRERVVASDVVQCRWEQRISGSGPGPGYIQRVLPDGYADVIVIDGDRAQLAGPTRRAALPELAPGTVVVGLRVRTEAIRAVFAVPAFELCDRTVPLDEVLGSSRARWVTDALLAPPAAGDARLAEWLSGAAARVDGRVAAAVARLRESAAVDVASVAELVGLSCRQLRRVMDAECGMGPKTLQRIGRLHRFLGLAEAETVAGVGLAQWSVLAGYADQAHLTKDVTEFAAITPSKLLSERSAGDSWPQTALRWPHGGLKRLGGDSSGRRPPERR